MILREAGIITSTPSLTIVLSTGGEEARSVLNLTPITILVHTRAALERLGPQCSRSSFVLHPFQLPDVLLLLLVWLLFLSG